MIKYEIYLNNTNSILFNEIVGDSARAIIDRTSKIGGLKAVTWYLTAEDGYVMINIPD